MRAIRQYSFLGLMAAMMFWIISCKKPDIQGEMISISNVAVSLKSTNGRIDIPAGDSSFVKTPESVTIPIEVQFSDAVPKRFNVNVNVDNDTINKLIAENKLPNTVLLNEKFYKIPSNLDVRFGLDHYDFNLVVDITPIERNYGKNLAVAVTLDNPTKGDKLEQAKKEAIIIINTSKVITEEEIHYVYFTGAGSLVNIPEKGVTYAQSLSTLTVPVNISLGGVAAGAFNVGLSAEPDTVQKLIDDSALKNTVLLTAGTDYTFPDSVDFKAQKSLATFNLHLSVDSLLSHYHQNVAIALGLNYPSSHLLDSSKRIVVLVLNPVKLVEFDVTNVNSTLTVERENTQTGEISPNLVDNQINTKFLLFNFNGVWAQLEFASPQVAGAYTLTSANDHSERDPSAWQLQASNDGTNWKVLDAQSGQTFSARYQTKKFYFDNTIAYKYYRLNILSAMGGNGGLMQVAEWRLIQTP